MAIKWDESWNTKIAVIDQQHRKLVNIVNDLGEAMKIGKSKDVVEDVLTVLIDYTKTHFRSEERLMEQKKYDGLESHKQIHQEFVEKVLGFQQRVEAGSTIVSIQMLDFLSDWLVSHIKGEDMKYVPVLRGEAA